ncbi:NCS2 family permease [Microbacterium amylolyticum]|uniref:AGZA family xanthine/uracil permease-like MFS transporter n=1 Tax=Microbacterium amylolyticum TaxID=936337 RepID=A0ABS4ZGP7_9MICO|nr:NCS2 family permease [Microbacterium amylolyticum]MBP2436450.1 AGZA family xanthine/uracil permease-like MFS transporter [Microbacterium amylolyticum]
MTSTTAPRGALDRFFAISERGSSISAEIRGGLVTFFAMSYIIVLNPLIIGTVPDGTGELLGGGDLSKIASATALVAGVLSILMGVIANYPMAMAAGLGLNAVVAFSIAALPGMTWADAMGVVVLEGIILLILVLTGFRTAVFKAVPASLKTAIGVGIGMFITLIGLSNAGFVSSGGATPLHLGNLASWPILVFVIGLVLAIVLHVNKVKGGLLIAIIVSTAIAVTLENTLHIGDEGPGSFNTAPEFTGIAALPDFSLIGQFNLLGSFQNLSVIVVILLVFTLLLADFFDTMGTMVAVGAEANLLDAEHNPPRSKQILILDAVGALAGGAGSVSSNTAFVESTAGVGDGARTGLSTIVTGVSFLLATFLAPLVALVPYEAAAPALVLVGFLMLSRVAEIDWSRAEVGIPAFFTIAFMPFTYSIADGIGAGFIAFVIVKLATRKVREIHWIMWVVSALFMVYFVVEPLQQLFI